MTGVNCLASLPRRRRRRSPQEKEMMTTNEHPLRREHCVLNLVGFSLSLFDFMARQVSSLVMQFISNAVTSWRMESISNLFPRPVASFEKCLEYIIKCTILGLVGAISLHYKALNSRQFMDKKRQLLQRQQQR